MGGAYVVSRAAMRPLLAAAQTTPFLPFEDVYVSGLCAFRAGVSLQTPERYLQSNLDRYIDDLNGRSSAVGCTIQSTRKEVGSIPVSSATRPSGRLDPSSSTGDPPKWPGRFSAMVVVGADGHRFIF